MSRRRRLSTIRLPRSGRRALYWAAVPAVLALLGWWRPDLFERALPKSASQPKSATASNSESIRGVRVVDGDTLELTESKERVRLIGANTPETVKPNWPVEPWGPEASAFTKQFLAAGSLRLEFDGPRRDRYGRMLAYVWVGDRMLNEELIRAGLARADLRYSYSSDVKDRFRRAEAEAKSARRGIWSGQ